MKGKKLFICISLMALLLWLSACSSGASGTLPGVVTPGQTLSEGTPEPTLTTPAPGTGDPSPEATLPEETETAPATSGTDRTTEPLTESDIGESGETRSASAATGSRARPTKTQAYSSSEANTETRDPEAPDYTQGESWVYFALGEDKPVDVFLISATAIDDGVYFRMEDEEQRELMRQSLEKQRGIYGQQGSLYAPYYRQMALEVYGWEAEEQQPWRDLAFRDVADAFRTYLDVYDRGKPLIIAGFSQGSELSIRLMIEFFNPATREGRELLDRLVAVYAIGAGLPEITVAAYPWLRPAESAWDTGVIISFDCELPGITGTVLLPAGSRSMTINPLSWSRDGAHADKSLNLGAYFPTIDLEIPQLCGCYIEPERGALIVTGINPAHYPTDADVLPPGNLHGYDYQFFYRNIQDNVRQRIASFFADQEGEKNDYRPVFGILSPHHGRGGRGGS